MGFLNTLLSLILFLVALGVLITIHELGHFIAAKSFKVYCSDFSIGFGPKIINIKRKKGETTFKVGILPVGGYVSMYGEGIELPNGVNIPKSRSLEGIARYKRIIIMAAGIIMNFVLAYIIFFICASCFPQYDIPYANVINLTNSDVYQVNKTFTNDDGDVITLDNNKKYVISTSSFISVNEEGKDQYQFPLILKEFDEVNQVYKDSVITKTNSEGKEEHYVIGINNQLSSIYNLDEFSKLITIYKANLYKNAKYIVGYEEDNTPIFKTGNYYLPAISNNQIQVFNFSQDVEESFTYKISLKEVDENNEISFKTCNLNLTNKVNKTSLDSFGIGMNYTKYWNGWNSFKVAGEDWAQSTTLIAQALGGLFVGQGWDQMGGPVAIFTQTTSILQNNPFNYYLQTWGIISVNLALFNLLPFPGLDGWQILVTLVEGGVNTFKKAKYKTKKENEEVDSKLLKQLEEKQIAIDDSITAYENKFNTKFNEGNLVLKYGTVSDETNEEPEYKYFQDYMQKVEAKDFFVKENNLNEVEAYKEWKIPEKIKNIVSYVGLGLLFLLMIFVFIKDIVGLF